MRYQYFSRAQDPKLFFCSETGEEAHAEEFHRFVVLLDELRHRCNFPFVINSGYRSPRHSIEAAKAEPGQHTYGAADIKCTSSSQRHTILKHALELGFTGIGIDGSFIHVDKRESTPMCWVY